MTYIFYQVDAFADKLFEGNPAGVMFVDTFFSTKMMQKIAEENNLSETAFVVRRGNTFDLRWFTPKVEIDFCGHATIATAHVLHKEYGLDPPFIFNSKIGEIRVTIRKGLYVLSAPIPKIKPLVKPENLEGVFKSLPIDSFKAGKDIYFVFDTFKEIINYKLDITKISNLSKNGVGITARYSDEFDIISRFFVPNEGIAEDPVTGSAHAALGVYWSRAIGKNKLKAYQASERGGVIWLEVTDNRINIIGNAITYMKAEIRITHVD